MPTHSTLLYFACCTIVLRVRRTSAASSSGGSGSSTGAGASSLDKVLQDIQGPKAISTVAKSSYDWDSYKEQENLVDDLSKAAKAGYLTKQDFLNRCDVRSFEKERDERLRKAVTSSSSAPAGV